MSDQCERGMVWLCRDRDGDRRELMRVYAGQKPTRKRTVGGFCWQIHYGNGLDSALVQHIFGDLPGENEARLVDVSKRDWWCGGCDEWVQHVMLDIYGRVLCGHIHNEDVQLTKSRCAVVETIPLKEDEP